MATQKIFMVEVMEYHGDPGAGEDRYLLAEAFVQREEAEAFLQVLRAREQETPGYGTPSWPEVLTYTVRAVPLHR